MTKYKFASHQDMAVFMMECNASLGIFYAAGTGKSATALKWIYKAITKGEISDALIVCPASLVLSWEQAIEDMIKFEGFNEKSIELLKRNIKISSFQKLYKAVKAPIRHRDGNITYKRTISLRPDIDKRWGAVIVDESHNIGSHNSVQTKACITLAKLADHRYAMTGTPCHGGGGKEDFSKLYGQMQFMSAGKAFSSWSDFCHKYVTSFDMWHNPRAYDVPLCRRMMQDHAIVCRLEDCFDMPGTIEQDVACELAEKKVYKDFKEGRIDQYDITIENAGGQYLKMLQLCSGAVKTDVDIREFKTSKDDALGDILNGTDDPVVIFCNYRASIDRCEKLCKKAGKKPLVFDGRSKTDTWKDFQAGKGDVLICQYQSGGCGLNLQRAHLMVFFEPCMSALLMEQAKGRIYRKGQDKKCVYYHLVTPNSVEKKVSDLVRSGVDVSNQMLSDWANGMMF